MAEHLHDGPLQTLLAARLELDEARERNPDPALDMVYEALQETATGLRSTVTELHPQVLAQLGLTPAVRELLKQFETRTEIADDGRGFDPAVVSQYVADGHIGLGSHLPVRCDGRCDGHRFAARPRNPDQSDVAAGAG